MNNLDVRKTVKFSNKIKRNWLVDFPGVLLGETKKYYEIGLDLDLLVFRFNLNYAGGNTITIPLLHDSNAFKNKFEIHWGDGNFDSFDTDNDDR